MRFGSVAVVGAGWSGAVVARRLSDRGVHVEIFEADEHVGGHARFDQLQGVYYEPHGPHIFHTSDPAVAAFVRRHGLVRPYEHRVLTEVFLPGEDEGRLLSWPPQVSELRGLPIWHRIERDLDALPTEAHGDDFETYVISMMGPTLFDLFIRDYTLKQWGREPSELSSRFAPKRVELRTDGYTRLFRDAWEYFPSTGYETVLSAIIGDIPVRIGHQIRVEDIPSLAGGFDALVMTGPLDVFLGRGGLLEWRGIRTIAESDPTVPSGGTATPSYVVNRPSGRVPYTRTVETKHATGQLVEGTVVCREYPGDPARHYPVPTVDRRYERINAALQDEIRDTSPMSVYFTGRLATYAYINQDQAIQQAWSCVEQMGAGE